MDPPGRSHLLALLTAGAWLFAVGVGLLLWIIYLQSVSILRQGGVIAG